jgi:anti-sigma regulatory factor (Ser/Thr protein kinase)
VINAFHRNVAGVLSALREQAFYPELPRPPATRFHCIVEDDFMDTLLTYHDPSGAEFAHRQWPAEVRQLSLVRVAVRDWLGRPNLSGDARADMLLAINSAASNVVKHAYPMAAPGNDFGITFWTEHRWVWIEIVDHGEWKIPAESSIYPGRGLTIMQRLVDSMLIHHDARGTRVLLGRRLNRRTRDQIGPSRA